MDPKIQVYEDFADRLKDANERDKVTCGDLKEAANQLAMLKNKHTEGDLKLAYQILRCLRNSCIHSKKNQNLIIENDFVDLFKNYTSTMLDPKNISVLSSTEWFEKTKVMAVQFLGNLVAHNDTAKREVWMHAFPSFFFTLFANLNEKGKDCLCMVVYNCLKDREFIFDNENEFWLLNSIIEFSSSTDDCEWGLLVVELLFTSNSFERFYKELTLYPNVRGILLDVLHAYLSDEEAVVSVKENNLIFLADDFRTKSACIFMLAKEDSEEWLEESLLLLKVLSILCTATSLCKYKEIRAEEKLLKTIVDLLKQTNRSEFSSYFSKPAQAGTAKDVHPAYGFKRDLVRTIGNMCYKNKKMQDKVREFDGIRSTLNACNIDERNPFILQWAIFAVRNICEDNIENQELVGSVEKQGLARNHFLTDSNITTNIVDGKITISSKDSLNR
ncbi:ataxin-10-like isoform X1 [Hydractinia symbiolongicarpus]|uniref:ataxin-10-like isoform X1 n=2 Tax=Hydractinia symbiolongicarpus TaxID=13093 RepID=UPI0025516A34|nr:ataxin-10-like isoform X1 [Hydractinia symbiolongicarpus]